MTDRRALHGAPVSPVPNPGALQSSPRDTTAVRDAIRNAVDAGVGWIQIREKDLQGRELLELTKFAVDCARDARTKIIVNDRLDIAAVAGASGVHLGETSLPVEAVARWRQSTGRNDFLIGASCHSLQSALEAERCGSDYIFFGPVFATPSKAAFGAPQGIESLREVCVALRIPVIAIGGITSQNASECVAAGAAGVAAIRMFQEQRDLPAVIARLNRVPGADTT